MPMTPSRKKIPLFIPAAIGEKITQSLRIPTIGIGAGPFCDGQVLVMHDLLGMSLRRPASFVKEFANLGERAVAAIGQYVSEVRDGVFPGPEHVYADKPQKPGGRPVAQPASGDADEREPSPAAGYLTDMEKNGDG